MDNPLLARDAPPDLSLIRPGDLLSALKKALKESLLKWAFVHTDPASPTFENTVAPLEGLFKKADDIMHVLENCAAEDVKPARSDAETRVLGAKRTVFRDSLLGARFRAVCAEGGALDAGKKILLQSLHRLFAENGVTLCCAAEPAATVAPKKLAPV